MSANVIKTRTKPYTKSQNQVIHSILKQSSQPTDMKGALNPIPELSHFFNEEAIAVKNSTSLSPLLPLENVSTNISSTTSNVTFCADKPEISSFQLMKSSTCSHDESSHGVANMFNQMHRSVTKCAVMATAVATCAEDPEKENHIRKSDSQTFNGKRDILRDRRTSIFLDPCRRVGGFTSFSNENGDDAPLHIRELLVNWSENTTMHGVKYLWEKSDVKLRRYLWLLFVLCGICFMTVLIVERILYFYTFQVTVNVEINYNSTIVFPAITICNQNSFRITKANKYDFYKTLIHIYQHGNFSDENLNSDPTLNTSMEVIYNLTSFQLEEMLIKCTWNGLDCDASQFNRVVTEQGICFGFNYDQKLNVSDTGAGNGLSLLLDVHQYEYMPGPIASAGVRFLLHEASTYPRVTDLGEAVPTGTHTYIGAKVTVSTYLPPPYGDCTNDTQLEYYSEYNQQNCRIECETMYIINECKCRPFFMPNLHDVSVCTLYEHNNCFLPKKSVFKNVEHELCKYCKPLPCVSTVYEPSLSHASISKYVLAKLMSDPTVYNKISQRFVKTRDIASHVVDELRQSNLDLMTNILHSNDELRNTLLIKGREILQYDENYLIMTRSFHENALRQKIEATKFQMEIVNKDFVRGVESADERTLSLVSHQLFEFISSFKSHIKKLQTVPLTHNQERNAIVYGAQLQLENKRLCTVAAYNKIIELFNCYQSATPYWPEKVSGNFTREEGRSAIPASLLRNSLNTTFSQVKYGNRMLKDLAMLNSTYTKMGEILSYVMLNKSLPSSLNLRNVYKDYHTYSKNWYDDRGNYLPDAFYLPLRVMRTRLERLQEIQKKLHDYFVDLEISNAPIRKGIEELEMQWSQFDYLMNITALFKNHLQTLDINQPMENKSTLSKEVMNNTESIAKFERSIDKICGLMKMHFIENGPVLRKLKEELHVMWREIITDEDSWSYYRYKNWTWINLTTDTFSQEIERNFTVYEAKIDFKLLIGDKDRLYLDYLKKYTKELKTYYKESQINEDFFKNNILKLDFFFREMSFEKVIQQKAYKVTALLGDIGGMLGLFIGASFLTILEIFDFLGQIIFQANQQRKSKKKKKQVLYMENKDATTI